MTTSQGLYWYLLPSTCRISTSYTSSALLTSPSFSFNYKLLSTLFVFLTIDVDHALHNWSPLHSSLSSTYHRHLSIFHVLLRALPTIICLSLWFRATSHTNGVHPKTCTSVLWSSYLPFLSSHELMSHEIYISSLTTISKFEFFLLTYIMQTHILNLHKI